MQVQELVYWKTRLDVGQPVLPFAQHLRRRSIQNKCRWVLSDLPTVHYNIECHITINTRTVHFTLIPLITDPANQLSDTLFSVKSDRDRLVVVAE